MREHVSSYAFGAMFLAATLWMTFAIPRYLAEAIDTLSQDPPGDEGRGISATDRSEPNNARSGIMIGWLRRRGP